MAEINNISIPIAPSPAPWSYEDIYKRLRDQLPQGWFESDDFNLNTVLQAYISTAYFNYNDQLLYLILQTRIKTATDINLDNISQDFFGNQLPRRNGESDTLFRNRILANLLREKATRNGMSNSLYLLTGYYPTIFEPWNPFDCGGYNVYEALAYNTVGSYGSGSYPAQVFIDVYVDQYTGMGNYSGYNSYPFGYGAYGAPAIGWYGGQSLNIGIISDNDIYQLINMTKAEGVLCWVAIHRI